ncbi:MAG: hypothetical protein GY814_16785 [Gammaproteobacteria bacterium]|nr:hypothetical protein [Gammaproteobacteria bacterium]
MKKLIIAALGLSIAALAQAESQQSLAVSTWDFDAISDSHTTCQHNSMVEDKAGNLCLPSTTDTQRLTLMNKTTLELVVVKLPDTALAGPPISSTDSRYLYMTSRDGWVVKYDLQTGQPIVKIRAGLESAGSVISGDNRFLLVGNRKPADLVLLHTDDLSVARIIPVANRKGIMSPVAAVGNAGDSHGFIAALEDFPQLWKISYLDPAPIGFGDGWNHDYRCIKEHVKKGLFPVKRLTISHALTEFHIDDAHEFLVGTNKAGNGIIMDLDLSRIVGQPKIPAVNSSMFWRADQGSHLGVVEKDKTAIIIYSNVKNPQRWQQSARISLGPITTLASCPQTPVIWAGVEDGAIHLIDKQTLVVTKRLYLTQKGRINQITCSKDGAHMLLEITGEQTEMVALDRQTQKEVKRLIVE